LGKAEAVRGQARAGGKAMGTREMLGAWRLGFSLRRRKRDGGTRARARCTEAGARCAQPPSLVSPDADDELTISKKKIHGKLNPYL
jgi:hypothetical protein